MLRTLNQRGFEAIALIVTVLVVGVIGLASYEVLTMNKSSSNAPTISSTSNPSVPASIKTKADLTQTNTSLDASESQLNSSLDDSQLNSSLDATL